MKIVTAVVVGAGNRGMVYGKYALENPGECQIVGVAEPDDIKREAYRTLHSIPSENCFRSYEDLLSQPKFANVALICTQDNMHIEPALMAKEQGYHMLLEKPVANTPEDCRKVFQHFQKTDLVVAVCHVLRYTPFFLEIKRLLDENRIGKIISIVHNEDIGYYHFAHSYVRGNWRNSKASSPLILAKSCHDLDIIQWLVSDKLKYISSMGELSHFTRANKPHGAPKRCIDGCPVAVSCPYNALAIYAGRASGEFPRNIVEMIDPQSELLDKLAESNYINCVYQCDNDVADHQVVNMLYEGGCTVSLNITAFTDRITRKIIIMGPNGQITGDMEGNFIECVDFATMKKETIHLDVPGAGHSGGDAGLMRCFLSQVRDGNGDITTTINNSLDSHLMAFAAEKARKSAKVIAYQECRNAFLGL